MSTDFMQQVASDNVRLHAMQVLENVGHCLRWVATQPWREYYEQALVRLRTDEELRWWVIVAWSVWTLFVAWMTVRRCRQQA